MLKSAKNHPYGGMAQVQLFQSYLSIINREFEGDFSTRPEGSGINNTGDPPTDEHPDGKLVVYQFIPIIQEYVDRYTGLDSVSFDLERSKAQSYIDQLKSDVESETDIYLKERIQERIEILEADSSGLIDTIGVWKNL